MKILFVSSEAAPFAKTGGLADVAGALPIALARMGMDVRVVMPGYGSNNYSGSVPRPVLPHLDVKIGTQTHVADVSALNLPGSPVPVYFVNNSGFFHREGLYQEAGQDYPDNARRFAFFCKAVIWMIKGLNWIPDVIHCNDWQTALIPVMLKTDKEMQSDGSLSDIKTVFTIHNMAYQGLFKNEVASDLGLNPTLFSSASMEFYGSFNLMKGGLLYSDILTTVSPTYASEIQTPEFGSGLDGVLRDRSADLHGILNGIDYTQWNPENDSHLPADFSASDLDGKAECKRELQKEMSLEENPDTPLLVMISRLDPQKGLDILLPLLPALMMQKMQVALLGTGLAEYHDALTAAMKKYPGQMAVSLKFDNGLAHRIEAGGDIFLMPSRFEPCGLNQLYSLRYGTIPVVRKTGGLADSVKPISAASPDGTGFVFSEYSSMALLSAIQQAVALFDKKPKWKETQERAMNQDFSWKASAKEYAQLYTS